MSRTILGAEARSSRDENSLHIPLQAVLDIKSKVRWLTKIEAYPRPVRNRGSGFHLIHGPLWGKDFRGAHLNADKLLAGKAGDKGAKSVDIVWITDPPTVSQIVEL
jgi:hypothetical protein